MTGTNFSAMPCCGEVHGCGAEVGKAREKIHRIVETSLRTYRAGEQFHRAHRAHDCAIATVANPPIDNKRRGFGNRLATVEIGDEDVRVEEYGALRGDVARELRRLHSHAERSRSIYRFASPKTPLSTPAYDWRIGRNVAESAFTSMMTVSPSCIPRSATASLGSVNWLRLRNTASS